MPLLHAPPRVVQDLLQPERDAGGLLIHAQHLHAHVLVAAQDLGRMLDVRPGHLADRQQPVRPTEVDERAEVGQTLHRPFDDLTLP